MEITLYSKNGEPVAYIVDHDETIYLWDGRAVAYIYEDKVYGWNCKHLGWFVDGIIYDLQGLRVGFTRDTCPVVTYVEPVKYVKHVKYVKYVRHVPYVRPVFSLGYSDKNLRDFLEEGNVD